MNVLSSHPLFIKKEELNNSDFALFVSQVQDKGYFVKRITQNVVKISQTKESDYNNIVVCYPKQATNELVMCKFFNADGPFASTIDQPLSGLSLVGGLLASTGLTAMNITKFIMIFGGANLKNYDRILNELFCSEILKIFLNSIRIFRCPNCGDFTFKTENWERKDPRFTEERITHGLNALANVLFLGGHGAGGEWSQATKQRYKYEGFKLTCTNCGHVHKVITSTLPI